VPLAQLGVADVGADHEAHAVARVLGLDGAQQLVGVAGRVPGAGLGEPLLEVGDLDALAVDRHRQAGPRQAVEERRHALGERVRPARRDQHARREAAGQHVGRHEDVPEVRRVEAAAEDGEDRLVHGGMLLAAAGRRPAPV
jgi:hypothetical protein